MENYKYFGRQCDKHQPLLRPGVVFESCLIFTPAANSNDLEGEKKSTSDVVDNTVRAPLLNKTLPLRKIREVA